MNLIANARDAIQAKNFLNAEKEIVIATNLAPMDDFFLANHAKSGAGEWVIFSVRDNGIGIDSTVQAKIFEPFFITKEVGKGTGLGLSTVYGIVQQNKGYIDVQSEKNSGAVFKIYWPASGEQPKPKPAPEKAEIFRGNATIFLVEDDENIREFTVSALKKMGYLVFEAKNGKDAWEMLTAKPFKFNLLITDLSMPYMNGKELARQVETLLPDVVVLYMSGYADDQIFQNDILDNSANFIQKPFSMHVLSNRIHDLLREKQK
jgi:CheY-like chemotaxis protein